MYYSIKNTMEVILLDSKIFSVPVQNLSTLQEKINTLNKKALKLKCSPITITVIDYVDIETKKYSSFTIEGSLEQPKSIRYANLTINGNSPVINGYRFIATIDHLDGNGNMIRSIPSITIPEQYRTVSAICEHCNHNRYRKDTYLVQHEDGHIKQIGKSCLKDFLGHSSPEHIAKYAELLFEVVASAEDDRLCGRNTKYLEHVSFLHCVAFFAQKYGYVSKSYASKQLLEKEIILQTTVDRAIDSMFPDRYTEEKGNIIEKGDITQDIENYVTSALDWISSANTNYNDYMNNLQAIAKVEYLEWRHINTAGSLMQAYYKHLEKQNENEQKKKEVDKLPESQYIASIGDKIQVHAKVLNIVPVDGMYGTTYLHVMIDPDNGNQFTWFCSGTVLEKEITYNLKCTVKKHEMYNGIKKTVLTRCRIA